MLWNAEGLGSVHITESQEGIPCDPVTSNLPGDFKPSHAEQDTESGHPTSTLLSPGQRAWTRQGRNPLLRLCRPPSTSLYGRCVSCSVKRPGANREPHLAWAAAVPLCFPHTGVTCLLSHTLKPSPEDLRSTYNRTSWWQVAERSSE